MHGETIRAVKDGVLSFKGIPFTADGKPVGGPDPWKARLDVVAEAAEVRK